MSAPKSLYLDKDSLNKSKVVKPYKKIFAPLGVFIIGLLLSLQIVIPNLVNMNAQDNATKVSSNIKTANAAAFGGIVCGNENELGTAMDSHGPWRSIIGFSAAEGKGGRDWTIDEALGTSITFADYTGEGGKSTWLAQDVGEKRGDKIGNFSEVVKKLEEDRNAYNCIFGTGTTLVANFILNISSLITTLTQGITMLVFDSDFICTSADSKTSSGDSSKCFNILKVIGGDQGDGVSKSGIIGSLTSNLYLPLVAVVAILTAIWIAWTGLKNGKIREAFFGLAWAVGSFMFGYAILLHPGLVAKAPMKASNTLASCVVGAFNGGSCDNPGASKASDTGAEDGKTSSSTEVCKAGVSGADSSQGMALAMSGLTCQIWKAFVLEPYSNGSFGKSFEELDITDPKTSEVIKKAKLDGKSFCVSLHSDKSYDEMGDTLELTGPKESGHHVCNIAAYQLYLMTNATSGGDKWESGKLDKRWYNVIVAAANDESMWNQWHTSWATGSDKILTALLSVVASIFGGALLIVVALFALMFYLLSTILMAFAPLFFLMGIHPGRGRNLLKGWAETVISNVLKYLASAVFLIVSISLYGGVLGNIDNIGMTLIFILVLTLALFMYRKEIIDMLGKVNMGGEKIANKMSGVGNNKFAKKAGRMARTGTGSAIGSVMANGGFKPFTKETYAAAASGFGDGAVRELKRGSGVVAGAMRERDRVLKDNRNDLKDEANTAKQEANKAADAIVKDDEIISAAGSEINTGEAHLKQLENENNYSDVVAKENEAQAIEGKILHELANVDPLFARFQALTNQLENLKFQQEIMLRNGDVEGAAALQKQIDSATESRDIAQGKMGERQLHRGMAMYAGQKRDAFAEAGLGADYETRSSDYKDLVAEYAATATALAGAYSAYNDAVADKKINLDSKLRNEAAAEIFKTEIQGLKTSRDGFNKKDIDRIKQNAFDQGEQNIADNSHLYNSERDYNQVDMSDHFGQHVNAGDLKHGNDMNKDEFFDKAQEYGDGSNSLDSIKDANVSPLTGKNSVNGLYGYEHKYKNERNYNDDSASTPESKKTFKDTMKDAPTPKEDNETNPLDSNNINSAFKPDFTSKELQGNRMPDANIFDKADGVKANEEYHAEGPRMTQHSYGNLKETIGEDIRSGKFDENAARESESWPHDDLPPDYEGGERAESREVPFEKLSKENPLNKYQNDVPVKEETVGAYEASPLKTTNEGVFNGGGNSIPASGGSPLNRGDNVISGSSNKPSNGGDDRQTRTNPPVKPNNVAQSTRSEDTPPSRTEEIKPINKSEPSASLSSGGRDDSTSTPPAKDNKPAPSNAEADKSKFNFKGRNSLDGLINPSERGSSPLNPKGRKNNISDIFNDDDK